MSVKGYVMQLQPFSVNDGEGIRTTIFLAGAPSAVSGAPIRRATATRLWSVGINASALDAVNALPYVRRESAST